MLWLMLMIVMLVGCKDDFDRLIFFCYGRVMLNLVCMMLLLFMYVMLIVWFFFVML